VKKYPHVFTPALEAVCCQNWHCDIYQRSATTEQLMNNSSKERLADLQIAEARLKELDKPKVSFPVLNGAPSAGLSEYSWSILPATSSSLASPTEEKSWQSSIREFVPQS
jgi:hypothetical protein